VRTAQPLGDAEVDQHGVAPAGEDDVGRPDVPVDHTAPVGVVDGIGEPRRHEDGLARGQRPTAQAVGQRAAGVPFRREVSDVPRLARLQQSDDVGVVEPAEHLGLPPDAATPAVRAGGGELQDDRPTAAEVAGSMDLGHHPAVERGEDVVAGQRGGRHGPLLPAAVLLKACDGPADAARPRDVPFLTPLPRVGQPGVALVADDVQRHGEVLMTGGHAIEPSGRRSR
jgi:hypothetical protein